MDRVLIKRQVPVRAVVTDSLKRQLAVDTQEAIKKLDLELAQLDFSAKKAQHELKADPQRLVKAEQQIEAEANKRQETRNQLLTRLKDIARLNPGEEVVTGVVESLVEVRVGDSWDELSRTAIVLKDNVVVEIRS